MVQHAYTQCLKSGISIVTPNKLAFSASQQEWDDLQASAYPRNPDGGFLYHEATVGAGLPILSTIRDLLDTGDKVRLPLVPFFLPLPILPSPIKTRTQSSFLTDQPPFSPRADHIHLRRLQRHNVLPLQHLFPHLPLPFLRITTLVLHRPPSPLTRLHRTRPARRPERQGRRAQTRHPCPTDRLVRRVHGCLSRAELDPCPPGKTRWECR